MNSKQDFSSVEASVEAPVDASESNARDKIEQMLDQGLNSGESMQWTRQDAEAIKREIRERARPRA
jgi:hypothetical protein